MRITMQNAHYNEALNMMKCQRLDDRRAQLHMRILGKISCPILFVIMINLALKSPLKSNHWKFFDDVTISETICTGERSSIQWSLINYRIGYGKQHEFESKEV